MSKVISGTENFTNGPMIIPTGSDNKATADRLYKEILERLATHTHNGADSKQAQLPLEISEITENADLTYTAIPDGSDNAGCYEVDIELSQLDYDNNVLTYFYKLPASTEWTQFYPTIVRISATELTLITANNGYDLKVVG